MGNVLENIVMYPHRLIYSCIIVHFTHHFRVRITQFGMKVKNYVHNSLIYMVDLYHVTGGHRERHPHGPQKLQFFSIFMWFWDFFFDISPRKFACRPCSTGISWCHANTNTKVYGEKNIPMDHSKSKKFGNFLFQMQKV